MSGQFGGWPPAPSGATLVGRCIVGTDGVLAFSSRYPDGTPVFTTERVSAGVYTATASKVPVSPTLAVTPLAAVAAMASVITSGNPEFAVRTFDAAGVATDAAFMLELFAV